MLWISAYRGGWTVELSQGVFNMGQTHSDNTGTAGGGLRRFWLAAFVVISSCCWAAQAHAQHHGPPVAPPPAPVVRVPIAPPPIPQLMMPPQANEGVTPQPESEQQGDQRIMKSRAAVQESTVQRADPVADPDRGPPPPDCVGSGACVTAAVGIEAVLEVAPGIPPLEADTRFFIDRSNGGSQPTDVRLIMDYGSYVSAAGDQIVAVDTTTDKFYTKFEAETAFGGYTVRPNSRGRFAAQPGQREVLIVSVRRADVLGKWTGAGTISTPASTTPTSSTPAVAATPPDPTGLLELVVPTNPDGSTGDISELPDITIGTNSLPPTELDKVISVVVPPPPCKTPACFRKVLDGLKNERKKIKIEGRHEPIIASLDTIGNIGGALGTMGLTCMAATVGLCSPLAVIGGVLPSSESLQRVSWSLLGRSAIWSWLGLMVRTT